MSTVTTTPSKADAPSVLEPAAERLKYPPHPVAEIFPLLDPTGPEFLSLVEDIKENGLKNQIVLYDGKILDGRNRALALTISGREVKDYNFTEYRGDDPIGFVLGANLHRRHLSESQRAMVGAMMASFEVGDNQHRIQGCSIEQASKLMKVGISSIVRARKVLGYGDPKIIDKVKAGTLSVSKAAALKLAAEKQAGKEEQSDEVEEDPTAIGQYDVAEEKLLEKLGDLRAEKAEEHAEITIVKIKKQVGVMKKAASKSAA
jgi:hypothetical protein